MTINRRLVRCAVASIAIGVANGCGFLPAAHQVDLYMTSWTVEGVDGSPSSLATILEFNPNAEGGRVILRASCGRIAMSVEMDSDGDGIEFYDPVADTHDCPGPAALELARQSTALQAIQEWRVVSEDRIVLVGSDEIELSRRR